MNKYLLLLLCCMLWSSSAVFAQERTVSGTVTARDTGDPIPGVNVLLKGASTGTVTDINGAYSISVPETGGTLIFKFIGLATEEVKVRNQSEIDMTMSADIRQLTEVVVTAVGIERDKKRLGYAVEEVNAKELVSSRESNLVQGLNAKVAGVNVTQNAGTPGAASTIRIRGNTSITGDNSPLFVVDGIPVDNSITGGAGAGDGGTEGVANSNRMVDIHPDDVESLTVLKGTAATALYGLRAANGAIIITTKKGDVNQKMRLNIRQTNTWSHYNKMPALNDQFAQGSGGVYQGPETGQSGSWGPSISDMVRVPSIEDPYDKNGAAFTRAEAEAQGLDFVPMQAYNNVDDLFRTGFANDTYLSLSGGGDRSTYFASLGFTRDEGIIPTSSFQRVTGKISVDRRFTEQFKLSTSVTYSNSRARRVQQGSNLSGIMLGLVRTTPSFDNSNGFGQDAVNEVSAYTFPDGSQRNYRGGGGYDNPFWVVNNIPYRDEVNRVIGVFQADYSPLEWMHIVGRLGNDFYADSRNQFAEINSRNFAAGQVYDRRITNQDLTADIFATITQDFSPLISAQLIGGYNYFYTINRSLYTQGDDLSLPGFNNISNAATVFSTDNTSRLKRHGVYYDAQLAFKDMVFLNTTGRNDWSSTLPKDNNSFFQPTFSLSFVFSELFESNALSFGQFRSSWGQVKRDAPLYATQNYFQSASSDGTTNQISDGWTNGVSFPFNGVSGFTQQNSLGNDDIKPETQTTWELGLAMKFFENRFGFDVTWYNTITSDQIVNAQLSSATGFGSTIINGGEIESTGVEVMLNADVIRKGDFLWSMNGNFTTYENNVNSLAPGLTNVQLGGFTGTGSFVEEGQPYGVLRGGVFQRNDAGQIIIGADGFPLAATDQGIIGDPIPDFTAGLRNTFSWKGVTLSFLFDFRQGGDMWNGTKGALTFFGMSELTENRGESFIFNGVTETGEVNTKQVTLDQAWYQDNGGGFGSVDEHFVEETSWVRLRDVSLGFDLPRNWIQGVGLSNANVTFTGRNLWLQTSYSGIDPEANLTGTGGNGLSQNAVGIDYFVNPNTTSYSASLTLTF
ncbi:SusC/RagA family TonB-linked outer membrane protein [Persicobacter psychrovividus]|uniref:SusC/RagA family TonB-linked outer membrane protein n=1 Tax=Persicobacter psychrovividus TaxID=387638 RepID=A0ABM7VEU5_9BACT|nr:SusC/RagA family TonB-linked outer membrane protein [Persicobacter psychrovividus]